MSNLIIHYDEKAGAYPVRDYRCGQCKKIHRYKRPYENIPVQCSICGGWLYRDWSDGGLPAIQTKTERREVRYKLKDEVRQGKRPRAMDEKEHSIVTL